MLSKFKLNQLYFKDTQFANLMTRRIFNVLLIANPYDAFMLEDDGRIDEKIFNEYTSLSLRYPPRFTQVSTCEEALTQLSSISFDLIICMPGTGDNDSFDVARYIKNLYEQIPMVILTPFSHGITKRIANEDLSPFEYVFCWLGNTDLLVSIIKLIEDKMNLEHDVNEVGVQLILLVEDGIRFYSSILPNLYKFVLKQSQEFSTEALNAHQRTLRMRGRPKIVLARTYEEAFGIYQKYKNNILGVITDVRFPRVERGEKDGLAGIKLCAAIRKEDPFVPLIIQSSESDNVAYAAKYDAAFIDKNSKKMDVDLRRIVSDNFGFGDFIFRNPDTLEEIARVKNLKELQNILFAVPAESFLYHISRNHVSRWLYSRAMFPVAEFLRPITWNSLQDVDAHRKIIFEAIVKYRKMKNQGVVAVFRRDRFDRYSNFARIGDGSLGGKGRGLAFIDNLVKHHPEFEEFENARVAIPKTIVLCTDVFDGTQLRGGSSMMDCMRYKITIHDRPNEKNYYRLIIEENTYRISSETGIKYGPFSSYPEIINQEDIVLTDGHLTTADDDKFGILDWTIRNLSNVFTDGRFENGSYTLKIYTSVPHISESNGKDHFYLDVTVRLLSISQPYYRYLRAMNCLNSEDYNETFMEPVIVPQNVSGGLGFVGASSEQQVTLRMVDRPPLSYPK